MPTTPYSATLPTGTYTVTFPQTYGLHQFSNWRDLPSDDPQKTNPIRQVTLSEATVASLYAEYTPTATTDVMPIVLLIMALLLFTT